MKKIIIIISAILLSSCTSKKDFNKDKRILETQGFTDIKNTGHKWFCCSDDENFSTGFSAKDKDGKTIEGCFCSETLSFKGVTVRFR